MTLYVVTKTAKEWSSKFWDFPIFFEINPKSYIQKQYLTQKKKKKNQTNIAEFFKVLNLVNFKFNLYMAHKNLWHT